MKCISKILLVFIFILLILNSTHINVFANTTPDSDFKGQADRWMELVKKEGENDTKRGKWTNFSDLAGILWGTGVVIVFVCGVILGIKYMFSSADEKANIKESLTPYIIGTVIILGALSIWAFLVKFAEDIF